MTKNETNYSPYEIVSESLRNKEEFEKCFQEHLLTFTNQQLVMFLHIGFYYNNQKGVDNLLKIVEGRKINVSDNDNFLIEGLFRTKDHKIAVNQSAVISLIKSNIISYESVQKYWNKLNHYATSEQLQNSFKEIEKIVVQWEKELIEQKVNVLKVDKKVINKI